MAKRLFAVVDGCAYPIIRTKERLVGSCGILNGDDEVKLDSDGTFSFDYDDLGTDVDWDSQETAEDENGERVFYDEDWDEWPESSLMLLEVDEDGAPLTDEDGDVIIPDGDEVPTTLVEDDEDDTYAGSVRRL